MRFASCPVISVGFSRSWFPGATVSRSAVRSNKILHKFNTTQEYKMMNSGKHSISTSTLIFFEILHE
jgi:hypothetical protein